MWLAPRVTSVPLPDVEVEWYRTPLEPALKRRLHALSDLRGAAQTLGFLAQLAAWFAGALYCQQRGWHVAAALLALLYGAQANFLINAMHELGHGNVFRTQWLNHAFCRVVSSIRSDSRWCGLASPTRKPTYCHIRLTRLSARCQ